jgi:uncharacterized MAPEG superfamily protein
MNTVLWCLLIVAVLPILLAFVGGYLRNSQLGSFDNNNPREQAKELTGAGSRAYAAQQNAWEALAIFTAAVVAAYITQADPDRAATLAMAFIGFRVLHAGFYLADLAVLRSLSFMGGMVCAVWMFVMGLV